MKQRLLWLVAAGVIQACSPSPSTAPPPRSPTSAVPLQAETPPAPTPQPEMPPAVELVDGGMGGLSYGLAPGKCVQDRCPAMIQLRSANKLLDSVALEFAASSADLKREEGEAPDAAGWIAGSAEGEVTTQLHPVKLAAAGTALLVQQVGGFEHVKRRYDVFTHDGAKLQKIWSAAEGIGPAWSMATVVPARSGSREEIVYLQGFRPGGTSVDTLSASRLVWDDTQHALARQPTAQLPAIIAGEFASVTAARRAAAKEPCIAHYWVLPAERFGGKRGRLVVAEVAVSQRGIDAAFAHACSKPVKRRPATFRPDAAFKE
jgi:hypothetical protein